MSQKVLVLLVVGAGVSLFLMVSCRSLERTLLFYPTHRPADGVLSPWIKDGRVIGYARVVASPGNVWLMLNMFCASL